MASFTGHRGWVWDGDVSLSHQRRREAFGIFRFTTINFYWFLRVFNSIAIVKWPSIKTDSHCHVLLFSSHLPESCTLGYILPWAWRPSGTQTIWRLLIILAWSLQFQPQDKKQGLSFDPWAAFAHAHNETTPPMFELWTSMFAYACANVCQGE